MNAGEVKKQVAILLKNKHISIQDIILTGFEPEIVLSSIRTQIQQVENADLTDLHSENRNNLRYLRSIPTDYSITNTSWRVLKLILGNTKLSNKWWGINE